MSGPIATDTLPVPVLKKLYTAALQRDTLLKLVEIRRERILELERIISIQKASDSATVNSYEKEISLRNEKEKVYEDRISDYGQLLKREKRKRWWTAAAGVLTTSIAMYLFVTK